MNLITDHMKRWVTGIALLVVVTIVGLIDNRTLMWAFLGVFYFIGFNEAKKLYNIDYPQAYVYATIIWICAYFYPNPDDLFFLFAIFLGGKIAFTQEHHKKNMLLPFLYPVAGFLFFLTLYQEYGIVWMFWLLVIVVITDVGAFVVGKSVGKTPFSKTSPNKTWEGVIGGIAFATVAGTIFGYFNSQISASFFEALIISHLTAVGSVYGDLFESYLKREAGVKDSGTLLPGHGGVLDRVDGYLFGAVVMVIALRAVYS